MSPKNAKNPKKRSETTAKQATSMIAKLRAELDRSEARVVRLKSKVDRLRDGNAELEKQVRKLTKKLARSKDSAPVSSPTPMPTPPAEASSDLPGPAWTVAQLRSEVAERGLVGVPSRATKAQLLAVLAPDAAAD